MLVIIAGPQLAPSLRKRFASDRSVALFTDVEALRAVDKLRMLRPALIALDPDFVAAWCGAMFIAQVKADPELATADLRVLTVVERVTFGPQRRFDIPMPARTREESAIEEAIRAISDPLGWRGIRRAERFAVTLDAPAAVNGEATQLVNLSATGVQLVSPSRLRPAETFRLTLVHPERETRLQAVVAWCSLQGTANSPAYRAGASFVEPAKAVIEAYCRRYGRSLDTPGDTSVLAESGGTRAARLEVQ